MIDVFEVHTVVLKKKSSPGVQPDKQLGWENAVLDLSSILLIKSELHYVILNFYKRIFTLNLKPKLKGK